MHLADNMGKTLPSESRVLADLLKVTLEAKSNCFGPLRSLRVCESGGIPSKVPRSPETSDPTPLSPLSRGSTHTPFSNDSSLWSLSLIHI